jgi:hypothetical protein
VTTWQIRASGHGLTLIRAETAQEALDIFYERERAALEANLRSGAAAYPHPLTRDAYARRTSS